MEKEIPKISFSNNHSLDIEVMTFDQLSEKLNQVKSHNSFVPHKIKFFLILILTKNSYTHIVDFKSYKLESGSALFVAKNQVHHFTKNIEKADGYCVVFNSLFTDKHHFLSGSLKLNRLFNYHIGTPVITQKEMDGDDFIEIADTLYKEFHHPNGFAKSEMLSTLLQVLFLKAERAKEFQAVKGVKKHWLETFTNFKDMLEEEYGNTRNSRAYASKLFISYKFLNDIVKQLTGKTVKAFIDNFVTIEIKRYLVSTSLSIQEIAYKTGFEEPSNMVKFFKKNAKTTPLKFRQQK
jgi:AraC-like DNA-binding protein